MPMTVAQLAQEIGGVVVGDGGRVVESCNTLMDANSGQVSLFHMAKYARELDTTRAGCVILAPGDAKNVQRADGLEPLTTIEAKNSYFAWQQAMVKLMGYRRHPAVGISPLASIHPTATIGKNANIHPFAVISENVRIGDNCHIYPHVTLMNDARVGHDSVLYPSVTIYNQCVVGNRCHINAGTVVGVDGFSYAQAGGVHHKMPQTGNVVIEDDVEIAANTVIERAALKSTRIGKGTKLGNLVIIGHNCEIGIGNLVISQSGFAGSTTTGKYVALSGQVAVNGHLDIPDFVKVGAQSGVLSNPEPNTEILGTPAMEAGHARRVYLNFIKLPELAKRLKELEKKLQKIAPDDAPQQD